MRPRPDASPPALPPRPRPQAAQLALFLALCAVLTVAGCVLVQGIAGGRAPGPAAPERQAAAPATALIGAAAGTRPAVAGAWRAGPSLGTERSEVSGAVVDGTIYAIGGLALDGSSLTTVEALPPGADAWQPRAPLPEPRDHLAAVDLAGRLYVVAGSPGWFGQQTSVTLWRYDPVADAWEGRAPLPLGRAAHAAAVLDGRLYVAGGIGPESERLLIYDPQTDAWRTGPPMSRPREHLAAAAAGGQLYVAGGRWGDVGNVALLEAYDPRTDAWRSLPPLPTARGGLAATALAGRLYVVGGEVLDASAVTFPQFEVYDPATETWDAGPDLPTSRHGLAAVSRDGEVYVLGGGRRAGLTVSGLVEIFTPAVG